MAEILSLAAASRQRQAPQAATPPDQLQWRCACGSSDFRLYADGACECAQCLTVSDTMRCFDVTTPPGAA